MISCDCGAVVSKKTLYRHKHSQKHKAFLDGKNSKNETIKEENNNEDDEDEEEEETKQEPSELKKQEEDDEEEEEVVEVKPSTKKSSQSKAYMDAIREKAIMKIKENKQMKLDKENEIKRKAEQYEILVKSLKEKEEQEKKQKELDKIKEMEYKSSQYDKLMKQQQRNNAISSLSNQKIIEDVKEQRVNYLMKYLQNPHHPY